MDSNKELEIYHQGEYFDIAYIKKVSEYSYITKIESNITQIEISSLDINTLYTMLSNKIITLEKTNNILTELTPIKKISKFLLYKYNEIKHLSLSIPYNKHLLASYLGLPLKELKKALDELKIKNIVISQGYIYNIINLDMLYAITSDESI